MTDAGERETGAELHRWQQTVKEVRPTIAGKLTAGTYALEMLAVGSGGKAASDIAKAVEKWAKDNRTTLTR